MSGHGGAADPELVRRLAADILSSRKYANLAPDVVRHAVEKALESASGPREASKRARSRLHQLYGAFRRAMDYRRIEQAIARLESRPREPREAWLEASRETSGEILSMHVSTAERQPSLDALYGVVFDGAWSEGESGRVLDLGCGLGPFALPWMGLPEAVEYHAVDLDTSLSALIDRYLAAVGRPGGALVADVLSSELPAGSWDVVLMLKLVPTLERQGRGSAARLLRALDARRIAVTFPRATLGGRRRGMDGQYARLMQAVGAECNLRVARTEFPQEILYLCRPGP